eukprot:295834_1
MNVINYMIFVFSTIKTSQIPTIKLLNAAHGDVEMPIVRLGTGGYGTAKNASATQPEHWNATEGYTNAIKWLQLGGTGFDSAHGYQSYPGYNDSIKQWQDGLKTFNTSYFDLLLIHYPWQNGSKTDNETDLSCNGKSSQYNATLCRQSTWKAYEWIYNNGGARAIGISNFEAQYQLQDIIDMHSLLPSVNQFEFHGYWHEYQLVEQCQHLNITVNSYSPLGAPDIELGNWLPPTPLLILHPVAVEIGKKYDKTAAQVWLRWAVQQGIVVNPRSWNATHMQENMDIFDFELAEEEMLYLSSVTPPSDPKVCDRFNFSQ